jgi:diacylglycerol kinase (ATP)
MNSDKIAILFNPSAAQGKAFKKKAALEMRLRRMEIPYDLVVTQSEDHLRALTLEQARKYKTLIGAGGDSTFHIMINEMIRAGAAAEVKFGMIAVGSSNDIAKEFGLDSLDKACLAAKNGRAKKIDLGCIFEDETPLTYFLGQANIGLGVFVNKRLAELRARKYRLTKRQTLAGILAVFNAYRSKKIPLPLAVHSEEGTIEKKFMAAVFSNLRFWATGKMIAPAALPDDGRLDACLIKECSFSRLAHIASLARKGNHVRAMEVDILRASSFKVSSENPFEIQTDGEILTAPDGRTKFQKIVFSVVPQALNIIY